MKKLGHRQKTTLGYLCEFDGWTRFLPAWNIVYSSMTERILQSLVDRGLAETTDDGYKPTDLGRKVNGEIL